MRTVMDPEHVRRYVDRCEDNGLISRRAGPEPKARRRTARPSPATDPFAEYKAFRVSLGMPPEVSTPSDRYPTAEAAAEAKRLYNRASARFCKRRKKIPGLSSTIVRRAAMALSDLDFFAEYKSFLASLHLTPAMGRQVRYPHTAAAAMARTLYNRAAARKAYHERVRR